jgi:hypothetical protein
VMVKIIKIKTTIENYQDQPLVRYIHKITKQQNHVKIPLESEQFLRGHVNTRMYTNKLIRRFYFSKSL